MRVIAIKLGFYGGHRVRVGTEFDFSAKNMKRDVKRDENGLPVQRKDKDGNDIFGTTIPDPQGELVLPSWVVAATAEERQKLAESIAQASTRARDAAIASAGPKRSKRGFAVAPGSEDSTDIV